MRARVAETLDRRAAGAVWARTLEGLLAQPDEQLRAGVSALVAGFGDGTWPSRGLRAGGGDLVRGRQEDCLQPGMSVAEFNDVYPPGTPVRAWPAERPGGRCLVTKTRSMAWELGHGAAVVAVDGLAGGIALTHIQPLPCNSTDAGGA
jgi:hypothetical protein